MFALFCTCRERTQWVDIFVLVTKSLHNIHFWNPQDQRTLKKWYMPVVVAGSSSEEMTKVLEERDEVDNRLAHRMEQVINHSLKEAKGKAFGDTPYQPMEMGGRKDRGVKHKKDRADELKEVLIGKGNRGKLVHH